MKPHKSTSTISQFCLLATLLVSPLIGTNANASTLTYEEARHLLTRTEFCAPHERILEFTHLTKGQAARRIIRGKNTQAQQPLPKWYNEVDKTIRTIVRQRIRGEKVSPQQKKIRREKFKEYTEGLRVWWYRELLTTDSPFTEKMTLFWHNHFATSIKKVKRPDYLLAQNMTLRKHALGGFNDMLHAIAKDPAMIIFLDNQTNRKGTPNENFAREVMELFTLGEGHYTEGDIKEAARAFTGWAVNKETGKFVKRRNQHDYSTKKVLGERGKFDGEEVLNILLDQPQTATFITQKLWREFISPHPNPKEVARLANIFRRNHYDISALMVAILTSDHFYDLNNRTSLIKSPVDLVVGTLRQFEIHPPDLGPFVKLNRGLGQDLFAPPNVKGWPGGNQWINSNTLNMRRQFVERVFRAREMPPSRKQYVKRKKRRKMAQTSSNFSMKDWMQDYPGRIEEQRATIAKMLVSDLYWENFQADIRDHSIDQFDFLQTILTSPYYELK